MGHNERDGGPQTAAARGLRLTSELPSCMGSERRILAAGKCRRDLCRPQLDCGERGSSIWRVSAGQGGEGS